MSNKTKKNRSIPFALAAALALGAFAQPALADPDQGEDGPGTPGTGEAGPGQSGPPSDGPGNDGADGNRDWANEWLACISHSDRPDWAHGEAEMCSETD